MIKMQDFFHGLRLLTHCGGGAYGDVYYCEDISGKKIAVKIVSKKKLGDSWERELRGVINYRKITENAPGLLQIFHVEEDEESFFYTMEPADSASEAEYVPDTLAHRLQAGPLPQTDLLRILSGVFNGIKLIHEAGFTHRDIKPDNILFVKGVPKLADIGLMSSLSATMTQLAGTLDFIPPEERTADSLESSDRLSRQRNDLYAFGKVIYCAATGMSPHEYPATPVDMPLSLPLKYFLRLSYELCNKEPVRRLNSIQRLEQEFKDIERKLLYGETAKDKLLYCLKRFVTGTKAFLFSAWRLLKRYWYLMFLFILIGGGTAYWIWRPEPPLDITKIENQKFRSQHIDVTMTIPAQWEILTEATIKKKFADVKPDNEQEKKFFEFLNELIKAGADFICCDFSNNFLDSVTIQVLPLPGKELLSCTEDEMRFGVKQLFQGEFGFKTEIYEIKRLSLAGYQCIFIDLSHNPTEHRINNYIFPYGDKSFSVALTSKLSTFDKNRKQFEAALKTLKIGK